MVDVDLTREVAIPEAVVWKRTLLNIYFRTIGLFAQYFQRGNLSSESHGQLQSYVIALFLALRCKLSESEREKVKTLENFIANPNFERKLRMRVLRIEYLYKCFCVFQEVIERLQITKPERPELPPEEAWRDF